MTVRSDSRAAGEVHLIAKGAGVVFAGAAAGSFLHYAFQVMAARQLGVEVFGLWTLAFVVFKVLAMAVEFGMPPGLVRYISVYRAEGREAEAKGVFRSGLRFAVLSGTGAGVLAFALSGPISVQVFQRPELAGAIRLFALAILPTTLMTVLLSASQGFKTIVPTVVVRDILEPALRIIAAAAIFALGGRLAGVTLSYSLAACGAAVLAWAAARRYAPMLFDPNIAARPGSRLLLSYAWPLFFVQALAFVIQWTGVFLLGVFRTPADVGIYGAAVKTALLGTLARNAFHALFLPVVSELDSRGLTAAMGETYRTVAKWVFSLNLPLFLGLALFGRPVLRLFGDEFAGGGLPLAALGIGWVIYSVVGPVGETLIMTGRQRLHLMNMAGTFVVNLALSLWLVPGHGPLGAAIATSGSLVFYSAAAALQVRFIVGLSPFQRTLWKPAAAGAAAAAVVAAAGLVFPVLRPMFNDLPAGIAGGVAFTAIYAGTLWTFGLDEADRRILDRIRSRILPERPGTEEDLP